MLSGQALCRRVVAAHCCEQCAEQHWVRAMLHTTPTRTRACLKALSARFLVIAARKWRRETISLCGWATTLRQSRERQFAQRRLPGIDNLSAIRRALSAKQPSAALCARARVELTSRQGPWPRSEAAGRRFVAVARPTRMQLLSPLLTASWPPPSRRESRTASRSCWAPRPSLPAPVRAASTSPGAHCSHMLNSKKTYAALCMP